MDFPNNFLLKTDQNFPCLQFTTAIKIGSKTKNYQLHITEKIGHCKKSKSCADQKKLQ